MNKRKRALLLASVASLGILCGCKQETKVVEKEGEVYIQNGSEYTRIDVSPKVFEPGEHIITYSVEDSYLVNGNGWGEASIDFPETPEGYRYVETLVDVSAMGGYTNGYVHIYINTDRVEVPGTYNPQTNTVEYITPGVVVKSLTLGN